MTMAEKKEAERLRFEVFNAKVQWYYEDIIKDSWGVEKMHDLMEGKYKERKSHTPQTPSDIKQQHGNIDKSCENFYLILQIIDFLTEWLGDKARQWMD